MRSRGAAFGAMLALAACAGASTRTSTSTSTSTSGMPRPGPLARQGAEGENARCEGCHREAAAEWRSSLHAQAWSDPVFQRSYELEPAPFCRDCHAPETAAPAIGIACVTCHDPAGRGLVLAGAARSDAPAPPHPVQRDARFAGTAACAGCHEFPFPDAAQRGNDGARMQRTVTEHAASRYADRACATCHMPTTPRGGRGHGFAVASDPALLRRALLTKVARHESSLAFDLAPGEVGHAVPTGDLFRRLVVVAEVIGEDYQLVTHVERPLGRHFRFEAGAGGGKVQREIADDRVQGAMHLDLDLGPRATGQAIAWRIEWQRVQSMHGDEAVVAATVVLAEGRLPAEERGSSR